MYTQIWNKYLPVIRILIKRTASSDQALNLNPSDFKNAGAVRKSGYKFEVEFVNGKVANLINLPDMGKDFATSFLLDKAIQELLTQHDFVISMNGKFQLTIRRTTAPVEAAQEEVAEASSTS